MMPRSWTTGFILSSLSTLTVNKSPAYNGVCYIGILCFNERFLYGNLEPGSVDMLRALTGLSAGISTARSIDL